MAKRKRNKNRKRQLITLAVILVLLFGASYLVARAINPYLGWQSYRLRYERLKLRYPQPWRMAVIQDSDTPVVSEEVRLSRPNSNVRLDILVQCTADGFPQAAINRTDMVHTLGQDYFLQYVNYGTDYYFRPQPSGKIDEVLLSTTKDDYNIFPETSIVTNHDQPCRLISRIIFVPDHGAASLSYPIEQLLHDQDYLTLQQVMKSFRY